MAKIYLDTQYYTGHVSAIVIQKPLYPLIIGNIPGINASYLKFSSISPEGQSTVDQDTLVAQGVVTCS